MNIYFITIISSFILFNCNKNINTNKQMQLYIINQSDYKHAIINNEYKKVNNEYNLNLKYPHHFLFKKCDGGQIHAISLPKEFIRKLITKSLKNSNSIKLELLDENEFNKYLDFIIKSIDDLKDSASLLNIPFLNGKKDILKQKDLIIIPSEVLLGNDIFYSLSQIENNSVNSLKKNKLDSFIKIKFNPKNYKFFCLLKKSKRFEIGPENKCPLCLSEYKNNPIINHKFHKCKTYICYDCLKNIFDKGSDTLCPFCKQDYFII